MRRISYLKLIDFREIIQKNHGIILAFSVAYFFFNCFFGLDFTDGFFHINAAVQINGKYPFETILTCQVIHFFYEIFGRHFIYYRLLNAVMILSGFFILAKSSKSKVSKQKRSLLISSFIILGTPIMSNILGYDTLTLFMLMIIISYVLNNQMKSIGRILLLGLLTALLILIRIPNALLLFFLVFPVLYHQRKKNGSDRKIIAIFFSQILVTLIIYSLILIIMYPSLSDAFSSFSSNNDHHINDLLSNYIRDGKRILCYLALLIGSYYFIAKSDNKYSRLLFTLIQLVFLFGFIFNTPYVWNYTLFISALNVCFVVILFAKEKKISYNYLFVVLASLVLSVGSNTGLSKTAAYGIFGLYFGLETLTVIDKRFLYRWLIILLPFSILENVFWTYEDGNIMTLRKPITVKGLTSVITTNKHDKYVHAVINKSDSLQKERYIVYYYGYYSHLFSFLYPIPRKHYSFDQRFSNTKEIAEIIKAHQNQKIAIFITDNIGYQKRKEITVVESMLLQNGFVIDNNPNFTIYKK